MAALYLQYMIELCAISMDQLIKNKVTYYSVDASATSSLDESFGSLESSSNPVGTSRTNTLQLNLISAHSHIWSGNFQKESNQDEVSESRLEITVIYYYVLILQPFSFAFSRPALTECPVVILFHTVVPSHPLL